MNRADQLVLVSEAALAPSVHNVQPARWRFADDHVELWEDLTRRLPAGDPQGRDAAMSLGAAAEGMALALSARGLALADTGAIPDLVEGDLALRWRFQLVSSQADPLQRHVAARRSHRGTFETPSSADRQAAVNLASDDCTVVTDSAHIGAIAQQVDRSGHRFFRDPAFRAELIGWMRLKRSDPRWPVDGLNAQAMAMSPIEAFGASLVLGPLFRPLDAIALAAPLTAEAATVRSASAILLFHRPVDEPRFDSGRAFYRLWLRVEASGLRCAVMASLADDPAGAASIADLLPPGRKLVSAMRVGRAPAGSAYPRARIAAADLLV